MTTRAFFLVLLSMALGTVAWGQSNPGGNGSFHFRMEITQNGETITIDTMMQGMPGNQGFYFNDSLLGGGMEGFNFNFGGPGQGMDFPNFFSPIPGDSAAGPFDPFQDMFGGEDLFQQHREMFDRFFQMPHGSWDVDSMRPPDFDRDNFFFEFPPVEPVQPPQKPGREQGVKI